MDDEIIKPWGTFDWRAGRLSVGGGLSYREWGFQTAVTFDYWSTTFQFHFLCFWLDIDWSKSDD